jgi:thiamine kinase-like enzyme
MPLGTGKALHGRAKRILTKRTQTRISFFESLAYAVNIPHPIQFGYYGDLLELTPENAEPYLAQALGGKWAVSPLGGGVSNTTLLAESAAGPGTRRIVVKQSLPQLRVAEVWFADRNRIHSECESIRRLGPILGDAVPRIVHEDRANCIFAMEAASPAARDWKTLLLVGDMDPKIAARVGEILATQIRETYQSREWREQFGSLDSFEQLRLDAYYAFTPRLYPELMPYFDACAEHCRTRRVAAVHGDFSPKNILVDPAPRTGVGDGGAGSQPAGGFSSRPSAPSPGTDYCVPSTTVWSAQDAEGAPSCAGQEMPRADTAVRPHAPPRTIVIDFEVIHFGDPSFDAAFLLNHLLLKARHRPDRAAPMAELADAFWQSLTAGLPPGLDWFEPSAIAHLGCLHLARVDGKSPAEYLDAAGRERVREAAKRLIVNPPRRILEAFR